MTECESISHGLCTTFAGHDDCIKVCLTPLLSSGFLGHATCPSSLIVHTFFPFPHHAARANSCFDLCRDPSQHLTLKDEIEEQSTSLYSTARLWDDGIINPTDTRDVVGLGLALASRRPTWGSGRGRTTWEGDAKGFGVFRM